MEITEADFKECAGCFRSQTIDSFRLDRGKRRARCKRCEHSYLIEYRARKRDASIDAGITPLTWRSSRPTEACRVVGRMIEKFGGLENLCNAWHAAIRRAEQAGDHRLVLRSLQVLTTLLEKHRQEPPAPMDEMSEPELRSFVQNEIIKMIQQEPAIVLQIAEQQGWRVQPPGDTPNDGSGTPPTSGPS